MFLKAPPTPEHRSSPRNSEREKDLLEVPSALPKVPYVPKNVMPFDTSPNAVRILCSRASNIRPVKVSVTYGIIGKTCEAMKSPRGDDVVVFRAKSEKDPTMSWHFVKEYNQLRTLDSILRTICSKNAAFLPQLPEQYLFGAANPRSIEACVAQLNDYFNHVHRNAQMPSTTYETALSQFLSSNLVEVTHDITSGYLSIKKRLGWCVRYCALSNNRFEIMDRPTGNILNFIRLFKARIDVSRSKDYSYGFSIIEHGERNPSVICSAETSEVCEEWIRILRAAAQSEHLDECGAIDKPTTVPYIAIESVGMPTDADIFSPVIMSPGPLRKLSIQVSNGDMDGRRPKSEYPTIDTTLRQNERTELPPVPASLKSPLTPKSPFRPSGGSSTSSSQSSSPGMGKFNFARRRNELMIMDCGGIGCFPNAQVFGAPLEKTLQFSSVNHKGLRLPTVVAECIKFLERTEALKSEGIFRVSGSLSRINKLEGLFEINKINNLEESDFDVNSVAGVLKRFLRMLPESLFLSHGTDLGIFTKSEDIQKSDWLSQAFAQLERPKRDILQALMWLLKRVYLNSDVNRMTLKNLAIVFSPTLSVSTGVIVTLIDEYDDIFGALNGGE